MKSKPATEATIEANRKFAANLPLHNNDDLGDIRRGLMEETRNLVIRDDSGNIVWDIKSFYDIVDANPTCPDTVNPSYWRHECRETIAGLFEVADGIWQVRGYDIANLTLIRSENGYIVLDVLGSKATAKAAMELAFKHLGRKPVTGVIITHSHRDHYNGLEGVVDIEDIKSGRIPLVGPDKFTEEVGNEAIFVGRAMTRRGAYQFGQRLPKGITGTIGAGLGKGNSVSRPFFVQPTVAIKSTGETLNIDGVDIVFQMTPETEAPAEFCLYFPQFKALCMGELVNAHMHNLLPIRGAQARSAKRWAHYLNEAIQLFGDKAEVMFITHHWPCWGKENIKTYLKKQRDAYKYINDQTIRHINHGQTMTEIADELELPAPLAGDWNCRGYYGHLRHNVKATYQRYLGWFDCNPANLDPLPPETLGRNYVDFMGGVEKTLRKARESFAKGEYRWAAIVLNHLVFGYPDCREARELLADAYEQLGYQAECGTWRNCYLNGAKELREGLPEEQKTDNIGKDVISHMNTGLLLDFLATRVDPAKAADQAISINIKFSDPDEIWNWSLENSAMNSWPIAEPLAQAGYVMPRAIFDSIAAGEKSVGECLGSGAIQATGDIGQLEKMFATLEDIPNYFFGIVTP